MPLLTSREAYIYAEGIDRIATNGNFVISARTLHNVGILYIIL